MKIATLAQRLADLEKTVHALPNAPGQQNQTTDRPEHNADHEGDATIRQPPLKPQVKTAPKQTGKPSDPWHKTLQGWKAVLEVIAIPFALGYAVVTYCQWRDMQRNFLIDERAWVIPYQCTLSRELDRPGNPEGVTA